MKRHFAYRLLLTIVALSAATAAHAQPADTEGPWSISFGIGWDKSISGNINSGGIGTLNGQAVVILKNTYEDVYGTGLHLRGGVGFMLDEETEVRGDFIFQSLDADLTRMGDIGVSNLYGQYTDYQSFGLDVGLRRYIPVKPFLSVYGEGAIGLGFVDKTDITFVAPRANLSGKSNDFYDQTTSFAFGGNLGVLIKKTPRFGVFGQFGLRWTSGMSEIDDLEGTGLETINDKSARWTFPFIGGVRVSF